MSTLQQQKIHGLTMEKVRKYQHPWRQNKPKAKDYNHGQMLLVIIVVMLMMQVTTANTKTYMF
jgi:hypothetical protein